MTSTQFSRRVLRAHAVAIFVMTGLLTIISTVGLTRGQGLYSFLQPNPWAYIGLAQAYWLMAVVGLGLWIGASQANPRPWHLIGALAHGMPIALNIIFFNLIASSGIGNAALLGLTFHCIFSALEVVAGLGRVGRPEPAQARAH
jgi:hypothetical protein